MFKVRIFDNHIEVSSNIKNLITFHNELVNNMLFETIIVNQNIRGDFGVIVYRAEKGILYTILNFINNYTYDYEMR